MAKTRFTYECGHDGVAHGRNRRDADNYAAYKAKEKCWECVKQERAAAAAATTEARALPPLSGTPKQINWANQLRISALDLMEVTTRQILAQVPGIEVDPVIETELSDALALLDTELCGATDASFWIDGHYARYALGSENWVVEQIRDRHLCPAAEQAQETKRRARRQKYCPNCEGAGCDTCLGD